MNDEVWLFVRQRDALDAIAAGWADRHIVRDPANRPVKPKAGPHGSRRHSRRAYLEHWEKVS